MVSSKYRLFGNEREFINGCCRTFSGHFWGTHMTEFHKTEVQTVLNRSKPWLNQKLWLKMQIFPFLFFCDILEKMHLCFLCFWFSFAFCVITVVPIMIQTCSAPQNDRLNLHFLKDFYIVDTKMARNGCKMVFYQMQILMMNL